MSFISRLLGRNGLHEKRHLPVPNESAMTSIMDEARQQNKEAVTSLIALADRQKRDAEMVRQVVHDIVVRANRRQALPKGGKAR